MNPTKTELRVVAGTLRGRRVSCVVDPEAGMRPTPQRVREALFSTLGHAVPDRAFYDLFAGTGINGLEAISRGASVAVFVEKDPKVANTIGTYLAKWDVGQRGQVVKTDVYRWIERWEPSPKPVTVFFSPPFADLTERLDVFMKAVDTVFERVADNSVVVLQIEVGFPLERLQPEELWDVRKYGRNILAFRVKGEEALEADGDTGDTGDAGEGE